MSAVSIPEALLEADEPSVRIKARRALLGVEPSAGDLETIRSSGTVRRLLAHRAQDGTIPAHPYSKWDGAHWVLAMLAELEYPPGDEELLPLREQVYAWLLSPGHERRWTRPARDGLVRIHASQEGNAIWALLRLGLADEHVDSLVERLLRTQWPDGGWNCDQRAKGTTSAFAESLLPLRALALHGSATGSRRSRDAAGQAAEVFLRRRLHRRVRDGQPTHPQHLELHYPCYFHYDVLFGLKVMNEAGLLDDPRCSDALELLVQKRLPDGGWPAEGRFYGHATAANRRSPVDWGGVSRRRANPWVTVDALTVLAAAGRDRQARQ